MRKAFNVRDKKELPNTAEMTAYGQKPSYMVVPDSGRSQFFIDPTLNKGSRNRRPTYQDAIAAFAW